MTKIVAFTGRKGSGKDTAAKALENIGYVRLTFAGVLKEMLRTYLKELGLDLYEIERMLEGDLKEKPSGAFLGKTPREAMQFLGTEWGRKLIHDTIWLNAFHMKAQMHEKVVCSDLRFKNELDFLQKIGAATIKIDRSSLRMNEFSNHQSEKEIDMLSCDFTIMNNGTIEELHDSVLECVNEKV